MRHDEAAGFALPRGATGFFRPEDGPLPRTGLRAFRTAPHAAARNQFVTPPAWARAFSDAGLVLLTRERLTTPLTDADTSVLTKAERRQVHCHGVDTLGGVLFNAWA
ncbi:MULTISPECIES: hypothetical protein [Streptomyces]|uniref:Uncharacterized protein n=2 Tax=Streptomyces TaxID=1883 RepID=A0A100YAF7_9ACTN|nr:MULTISPECIES: hypothetical protein [Streptomyces]KUH40649.1 hypothetical protein ATE80_00135 [Streptomyces kanasensis]UUS29511.1 hypothetical protein NRO40_00810 [Streptomyces changanensis]